MTCRIGVDPGAVARLMIELRPAQGEHGSLGCVQVVNPKMQVKLHRRSRVRPIRRLMARRSLERQVEACVLALAHRVPAGVRVDHRPPRQPAVEVRESGGIAAFQGDSAQLSNTTAHKVNLLDVWARSPLPERPARSTGKRRACQDGKFLRVEIDGALR
jgi:hypothetical protein